MDTAYAEIHTKIHKTAKTCTMYLLNKSRSHTSCVFSCVFSKKQREHARCTLTYLHVLMTYSHVCGPWQVSFAEYSPFYRALLQKRPNTSDISTCVNDLFKCVCTVTRSNSDPRTWIHFQKEVTARISGNHGTVCGSLYSDTRTHCKQKCPRMTNCKQE